MRSSDLRRYQKMLLEKRQEVLSANTDLRSQLPPAGVTEGDLVDQANAEFEAELQVRLHQTDAKLLRAIDEALIRIRRGTYGVCTSCERPISAARLRAVPWTHHCITCKGREPR
jgi:DnaK suppressor protein